MSRSVNINVPAGMTPTFNEDCISAIQSNKAALSFVLPSPTAPKSLTEMTSPKTLKNRPLPIPIGLIIVAPSSVALEDAS